MAFEPKHCNIKKVFHKCPCYQQPFMLVDLGDLCGFIHQKSFLENIRLNSSNSMNPESSKSRLLMAPSIFSSDMESSRSSSNSRISFLSKPPDPSVSMASNASFRLSALGKDLLILVTMALRISLRRKSSWRDSCMTGAAEIMARTSPGAAVRKAHPAGSVHTACSLCVRSVKMELRPNISPGPRENATLSPSVQTSMLPLSMR
mmetsp:Transcript_51319/g.154208  ORF Transcript_51319/g.154208 Transcript_51319/m.154208 type:complete len:204 (-) Transcript_51319:504-1115(-)